jgi:ribosomal-protein-alanine N-acetyltransferase
MRKVEKFFLKSDRLGFRQWCEDDLAVAIQLWGDYEVTRLFDARGQWSPDEVQARLTKEIRSDKQYSVQYWPVFLLASHEHIGCCGLRAYDLSQGKYEIGFHIRSDQWRRGYAREAAAAVIDYAFNTLMVNSLFAGHNPNNTASRHLIRQLGFRYTHDEFFSPTGLNHLSYEMNASEYSSSKSG